MPSLLDLLGETWPARMAKSAWSAAKLPGDVYAGRTDPLSDEGIGRAADLGGMVMGGTFAGAPAGAMGAGIVKPIRAYHGSPHDFERFDLSKIGTGEGAQAYGHGLYFAENPAVAQSYKQVGTKSAPIHYEGDSILAYPRAQFEALPEKTRQALSFARNDANIAEAISNAQAYGRNDIAAEIERLRQSGKLSDRPAGRMYEVNINADPAQFLDWDKALNQQGPEVTAALQQSMRPRQWQDFAPAQAGTAMKQGFIGLDERIASDKLEDAGIPGIKYLDQGSRGPQNFVARHPQGGTFEYPTEAEAKAFIAKNPDFKLEAPKSSSNYVLFRDDIIDIVKKYGIAGAAAMYGISQDEAKAAMDNPRDKKMSIGRQTYGDEEEPMPSNVVAITGYQQGGSAAGGGPADLNDQDINKDGSWTLEKCIHAYTTYLDNKVLEIQEQQNARRYRHGAQWTAEQIKALDARKQPVVTYNKIGRKIDGIVGLVERLKQDPKAYPRTPQHQQGADLATAVLRYIMDRNKWNEVGPIIAEAAAVDGIGGIELDLKAMPQTEQTQQQGPPPQQPDYDVLFGPVDNDGFFYDPRSFKHDFSDARYMGVGKYVDEEMMIELMPGMEDDIRSACDASGELTTNSDRDTKWFQSKGDFKQVRLVDIWYKSRGTWRWALFTGSKILMQGETPFKDEDDKPFCKYLMFSAQVDHEGDRYGFPRNLQSAQDEVNQRRSKGLHELNNRRIIATKAAVADGNVEALRREAARSDGIVLVNTNLQDITFDDQAKQAAVMGQLEFMRDATQEIENFGPNPALAGGGQGAGLTAGSSGRAIALLQQAGIAELGPYMLNMRAWKMRVYRSLFNAVQKYWTNERWIRVTDAEGQPQFVKINETVSVDPVTGMPMMRNAVGELDVDIILDEGPDSITLMQDTYDAISQALPAVAPMLSPAKASAVMDVLIETSPLPADIKKKFRDAGENEAQQPDPKQQEAQAKLALQQQEAAARIASDQQNAQSQLQIKQAAAAAEIQIKREAATNEIAIERDKAHNAMQLELFKAHKQAELQQNEAALQLVTGQNVSQPAAI